ncbi:tetratricopeptide repeat protein [Planktotalea sp.]|uniref:tetratricopeptide repeat protein n=1 Tax=Planktotalea sp. TaxID=2029877 RepID=UPI003C771907
MFLALVVFSIPYTAAVHAQDAPAKSAADVDVALLLSQLRKADAQDADRIARQIKGTWSRSGSASADLLLKRGRDALRAKQPKVAIEHLTALTDHAPDFAEGWHMRASAFYQEKLYGPAVEDLSRVLALNPNHFEAIQGLGAIFEQLGDKARAYEVYEQVLAIHPHHADVLEAMERLETTVKGPAL